MEVPFLKEHTPTHLWPITEAINNTVIGLREYIQEIQQKCEHAWEPRKWRDPKYSPRVDGKDVGTTQVINEHVCSKCNLHKPFKHLPFHVCHKCGGTMQHARVELFGQNRIHINKCESCGHEYDTT